MQTLGYDYEHEYERDCRRGWVARLSWLIPLLLVLLVLVFSGTAQAQQGFKIFPEQQQGFSSYIRTPPTYIDAVVLLANANQTYTIPPNADAVIFSSNCAAFYAIIGPTATVPAANVTNGSGSELNPAAWFVGKATQIGLIAPGACIVTLSWYKLVLP